MRRNSSDPIPAVLLARLAVDAKAQGYGIGAAPVKHFIVSLVEIARVTGVRVLLVHAANEPAALWYRRFGFERSPIDDLTLMLLLDDVEAATSIG